MRLTSTFVLVLFSSFFVLAQQASILYSPNQKRYDLALHTASSTIEVCHLEVGSNYTFYINPKQQFSSDHTLKFKVGNSRPLTQTITATSQCHILQIETDFNLIANGLDAVLSIAASTPPVTQQNLSPLALINTSQNSDANFLIREVFIGGDCFDVSGITQTGTSIQTGTFANGSTTVNLEDGVVISTGDIGIIPGPNSGSNSGFDNNTSGSDSDLDAISSGGALFDIASIEFDFQPTLDQVSFEYVFASDEYCEYANTTFNDVFGFFISGPGISGPYTNNAINLATIPGTTDNVAINSINHTSNTAFYIDNEASATCAGGSPAFSNDFELDGLTQVFTATTDVIPCETYHIKLIIADRGDGIYDSAVFLKANSFTAGGAGSASAGVSGVGASDNTAYESCGDGIFVFERTGDLDEDIQVDFTIAPESTATPGVDYATLPNSITIPAGQTTFTLDVDVFPDNITEGTESIILELTTSCSCSSQFVEFFIEEAPPLEVASQTLQVCANDLYTITPSITGGISPYSVSWSDGSSGEVFNGTSSSQPQQITATVTDICNNSFEVTYDVIPSQPTAVMSGQGAICAGIESDNIQVAFQGEAPFSLTYQVAGINFTESGIFDNQIDLPVSILGEYQIIEVTDNSGCSGPGFGTATIDLVTMNAINTPEPPSCVGAADGAITLEIFGGNGPFSYQWPNDISSTNAAAELTAGNYVITITDSNGCIEEQNIFLSDPPAITVETIDIQDIDCLNTTGSISTFASGGTGPISFQWSNLDNISDISNLSSGTYELTVTDNNNCQATLSVDIEDFSQLPIVEASSSDILSCINTSTTLTGSVLSNEDNLIFSWINNSSSDLIDQNSLTSVTTPGEYTFIAFNPDNNCADSSIVNVQANYNTPISAIATPDVLTCTQTSLIIDGSASTLGDDISYSWSTPNGNITSPLNETNIEIDNIGTYILTTTDNNSGCEHTAQVIISNDITPPNHTINTPALLNCNIDTIGLISQNNSNENANYEYSWLTPDGNIVSQTNEANALVDVIGTYQLLITNTDNGCSQTLSTTVLEDFELPDIDAGDPFELSCSATSTELQGILSSNQPVDITWSNTNDEEIENPSNLNTTVYAPGVYILSVTNLNNGCVAVDSVTIIPNDDAPIIDAQPSGILNCYTPQITIDAQNSEQQPSFSYEWLSPDGEIIQPNPDNPLLLTNIETPGIYTFSITDQASACFATIDVEVTQNNIDPVASINTPDILTCYTTSIDVTATTPTNNFDEYTTSWLDESGQSLSTNEQTISVENPGLYTFQITNIENGCSSSFSTLVPQDILHPNADAGSDLTLNCTIENIDINSQNSSTASQYEYQWMLNDNIVANTLDYTATTDGEYTLIITDTINGCQDIDLVNVVYDTISPTTQIIQPEILTCQQPVIDLIAINDNNIDYQWTALEQQEISGAINNNTISVNEAGLYQLSITDLSNGCTANSLVEVPIDTITPIAQIATPEVITCDQLTIPLIASISSVDTPDFVWENISTDEILDFDNANASTNQPGQYQVTITNLDNGCTTIAQTMVNIDTITPIVHIAPVEELNCQLTEMELNASLDNNNNSTQLEWTTDIGEFTTPTNTLNTSINAAGMYTLTATNLNNGCQDFNQIQVNIDTITPVIDLIPPTILDCENTTTTLNTNNPNTPNMEYNWVASDGTPLGNTDNITTSTPGTYLLQLTNPNNFCENTLSTQVGIDTLSPSISIVTPDIITCDQTTIELNSSIQQVNAPIVQWTVIGNGNITQGQNSNTPTVNQAGTYQVHVTNPINHCISLSSIDVAIDTITPIAHIQQTPQLDCETTSLTLSGSISNLPSIPDYEWATSNGNYIDGTNSLSPTINAGGNYTLYAINPQNGCSDITSIFVPIDTLTPSVDIIPPATLTCDLLSTTLTANNPNADGISYQWTDNNGINYGSTNSISTSAPNNFQLVITNENNHCIQEYSIPVLQDITQPSAEAGETFLLDCFTTQLALNGQASSQGGNFDYSWTTPDGHIINGASSLTPLIGEPGTYQLLVTNLDNGCDAQDQTNVGELLPTADIVSSSPICPGEQGTITIQGSPAELGPFVYSVDGDNFQSNSFFSLQEAGLYQATVQDVNGCEYSQDIIINPAQEVNISLPNIETIQLGDQIQLHPQLSLHPSNIAEIQWSPATGLSCTDCLEPIASPFESTAYTITVTSTDGCASTNYIQLIVDRRTNVYIPNAFTPQNKDGNNDVFMIYAKPNSVNKINVFQIYSRWGEPVFEAYDFQPNDPAYGWNGRFRDQNLNSAVFVYWAEIELIDGSTIIMKGDVTLVTK